MNEATFIGAHHGFYVALYVVIFFGIAHLIAQRFEGSALADAWLGLGF